MGIFKKVKQSFGDGCILSEGLKVKLKPDSILLNEDRHYDQDQKRFFLHELKHTNLSQDLLFLVYQPHFKVEQMKVMTDILSYNGDIDLAILLAESGFYRGKLLDIKFALTDHKLSIRFVKLLVRSNYEGEKIRKMIDLFLLGIKYEVAKLFDQYPNVICQQIDLMNNSFYRDMDVEIAKLLFIFRMKNEIHRDLIAKAIKQGCNKEQILFFINTKLRMTTSSRELFLDVFADGFEAFNAEFIGEINQKYTSDQNTLKAILRAFVHNPYLNRDIFSRLYLGSADIELICDAWCRNIGDDYINLLLESHLNTRKRSELLKVFEYKDLSFGRKEQLVNKKYRAGVIKAVAKAMVDDLSDDVIDVIAEHGDFGCENISNLFTECDFSIDEAKVILANYDDPDPEERKKLLATMINIFSKKPNKKYLSVIVRYSFTLSQLTQIEDICGLGLSVSELGFVAKGKHTPREMLCLAKEIKSGIAIKDLISLQLSPANIDYFRELCSSLRSGIELNVLLKVARYYFADAVRTLIVLSYLEKGGDVDKLPYLLNSKYNAEQLVLMKDCLVEGVKDDCLDAIKNPNLSVKQMELLVRFVERGLTPQQLKHIADPQLSPSHMNSLGYGYLSGLSEREISCFLDPDLPDFKVMEKINILKFIRLSDVSDNGKQCLISGDYKILQEVREDD